MRRILIAFIMLVAVGLFVAPSLAVPSPSHKVTWRGSGISADNPSFLEEIIGDQVKFAGVVEQDANGIWSGQGTFVDRRGNVKADLVVSYGELLSESRVHLSGDATIADNGVTYPYEPFELDLDESNSEIQLMVERTIDSRWLWWIPGSQFKGSIGIT